MRERQTVHEYFAGPEDVHRRELVWGVLHRPPAPFCDHQSIVTRATVLLALHVRARNLGRLLVSPVDVVFDERKALVLQPDIVFVSNARAGIVRDRVWGAPDLGSRGVVAGHPAPRHGAEASLVSPVRRSRASGCIDPVSGTVTVLAFGDGEPARRRSFRGDRRVQTRVLSEFDATAADFFQ